MDVQAVRHSSSGLSQSRHNGQTMLSDSFHYPISVDFYHHVLDNTAPITLYDYEVNLTHNYDRSLLVSTAGLTNTILTNQTSQGKAVGAYLSRLPYMNLCSL